MLHSTGTPTPSTRKAFGEWECCRLPDLREAARAHIGQQGELKYLIALILLLGTEGIFMRCCSHHVADDQAVRAEPVKDTVQRTFEKNLTALYQHSVYLAGGKGRQNQKARLGEVFTSGSRRQTCQQHICWTRITDRERSVAADVVIGRMAGAAHEAIMVLPA